MLERLIHSALLKHFFKNNPISPNQSGFKPGDSCTNQLIAIAHDIFKGFYDGLEIRCIFIDISQAFNKVGHGERIYKLRRNGICGNLLQLLISFLDNRKQRV